MRRATWTSSAVFVFAGLVFAPVAHAHVDRSERDRCNPIEVRQQTISPLVVQRADDHSRPINVPAPRSVSIRQLKRVPRPKLRGSVETRSRESIVCLNAERFVPTPPYAVFDAAARIAAPLRE